MKLVVFGLAVSSSWGNGHASLWRGLIGALHRAGHDVRFFERDRPWYAEHRDLAALPGGRGELVLYRDWDAARAADACRNADVAVVTSYCPDVALARQAMDAAPTTLRCFYDLDSPVTLETIAAGKPVAYVGPEGYAEYDLVLSYAGGATLDLLRERLGARRVAPLYGSVDPDLHRPGVAAPQYRSVLSYLGTYAGDRQLALDALFLRPAQIRDDARFVLAGSQYPEDFPWSANVHYVRHLPADAHAAFYAASRLTLNITRGAMARSGWCPSGRLFEAAACGTPILTDRWDGLDAFFTPGLEILMADGTADALAALSLPDETLRMIARRARERTLDEHNAARRAREMIDAFADARHGRETDPPRHVRETLGREVAA